MSIDHPSHFTIQDLLYDKHFVCPICDRTFSAKSIRSGKNQPISTDLNLYTRYTIVNPVLYDAILCNHCGYATLIKLFDNVLPTQKDWIKKQITPHYKKRTFSVYPTIDDAIFKHKMALLNSIVKKSKLGEQAYITFHISWLYSDLKDTKNELIFLEKSCNGFKRSLETEDFSTLSLDEIYILYIIAYASYRLGDFSQSKQYLSQMLMKDIPSRLKVQMEHLKELLPKKI